MQQNAKHFAEQLNQVLNELGLPANIKERSSILSKMLDIPKPQAWGLLDGQLIPDTEVAKRITNELEINMDWLS